jgi:GTP pyrophosphokinase
VQVWSLHAEQHGAANSEGLRRLLLAIVRDLRVVLVLLSRHLARFAWPQARRPTSSARSAQLTRDIHAPLANRLGIWQLKWELEDLAFRYLEPQTYQQIARLLDDKRSGRERYIEAVKDTLRDALAASASEATSPAARSTSTASGRRCRRRTRHRRALRPARVARAGRRRAGLLRGARRGARVWLPVPTSSTITSRAQAQRLSLAAYRGDRAGRQDARSADPHARDARAGRARRRRALEIQGRRAASKSQDAAMEKRIAWMRQVLDARAKSEPAARTRHRARRGSASTCSRRAAK